MVAFFTAADFRRASQALSLRCFWVALLLVTLVAPGCRNGWPFQTAQSSSSPKEKEAVAKAETDGKRNVDAAPQDGDAFATTDPPTKLPAEESAVQVAYHAGQGEEKARSESPDKSVTEKLPATASQVAATERLASPGAATTAANSDVTKRVTRLAGG